MLKTEAAVKAAEILSDQIANVKSELKKLQEECGHEQLQIADQGEKDLEKEALQLAAETELLKKSAPEANDDSNIQRFLAIAELEKINKVLRQQEVITQENLKSLDEDINGTKNLLKELQDMKNALAEMKAKDQGQNPSALGENDPNQANMKESQKIAEIENKIRGTRKVYKELKTFLGEFLDLIDPVEAENGGHLGNLLQELWSAFQNGKDQDEKYVKISYLVSMSFFLIKEIE